MKVLFLEDVPKIAHAGDIKEVANGYGRNYLIPKKLAVPARSETARLMELQRQLQARRQQQQEKEATEMALQLDGQEISLTAKAGTQDRLYGSITSADIAATIESTLGLTVDKRKIELAEPIRQLGDHEVTIKLGKDLSPRLKVTILAESVKTEDKATPEESEEVVVEPALEESGETATEAALEETQEVTADAVTEETEGAETEPTLEESTETTAEAALEETKEAAPAETSTEVVEDAEATLEENEETAAEEKAESGQ